MKEKTTSLSGTIAFLTFGSTNHDELMEFLVLSGFQVELFSERTPDFEKIALLSPGLLLFDFDSTQLNRLEVFRRLKRIPRLIEIPILFVSDTCDEQTTELVFQLGVADLICFPFQKNEVLFRVKKHFTNPVSQAQRVRQPANINEARLESLLAINEYQTDSIQELLDFTLSEIVFLTGSKIGYIYFYDEQKQEFTLNTWSKEVMDECKVLEPQTIYQLEKTGIWGEVVRQRRPIMVNEFQAPNPLKKGVPEGHVILTRFLSIPVFDNNQIVAVVGVGNKEEEYDQSDIRQLSLMMNSIWAIVRKKASEKKLVESEKKFRSFFEHSPIGISITSINGTMRFNQAFCEMLGYTAEELIAIKWQEVTHPSDIETSREMIEKMLSGEIDVVQFEKRFLHKNGTIIWANVTSVLERDNEGKPLYFITSINNITEKIQAEKALLSSEDRFRRVVELSPIGKYLYQLDEKDELILLQANISADEMLGVSHNSFIGKTIQQAFPGLAETDVPDRYRRIAKGELDTQRFEIKYNAIQIDQYFEVTAFRIGENTVAVDFADISQRKLSEKKLKESEERYRLLFENNPQAMWIYDTETLAFLDVNEATVSKYGFSKDEFLSMTIKDIRPEKETDHLTAYLSSIISPLNTSGIWTHQKKNGELIDVEIISHQIDYQSRSARLVLLSDVTERVKAETALLESEERFRTTLYSIGDGVITTDAFGKVQMMNTIAEKLTGWSQSEAKGLTLEEVFPIISEETGQPVEIPVRKVLREGAIVGLGNHTILISKGGAECPIADSAAPITSGEGHIIGAVLVFRDQTKEREAERILQESEFFFRESQKAAKIGSYKFDISTGIWTSSEVLDEIFGIEEDFIRDINGWEQLIFPDDLPMMDRHLKIEVIQEKQPFNKEYRIFRKSDGALRWVHGMGQLLFDKNGTVLFMIGTIQDITERKKAGKALLESEERYNAFINADTDMIFVKDDQYRYVLANEAMARFFDTTREQVLGKTDQELAENTRVYPCKSSDQRIIDKAETFMIEERLGNRIYEVTKFPLELRDNKRGIGGIMRDVTERRRDEEAIQNERQLLRTLIDNLPFSIYVKDLECRKVVANITDVEKLGYTSEAEVLGKTDLELFEGEIGVPSYNDDLLVLKEGHSIINREELFPNPEGGIHWTVTTKIPLFDQSGKIVGMVGIGRDITEQKKAQETIQKLSKSIEQSPATIVITDAQGIIEYANPRFSEVTGYRPEEVIGQMLRMLKPGKINPEQLDELWKTINSGETWRGIIDNQRKNKTKYLDSVVVTPVLDEHKRITNILIICEDITLQKREEKLKEVIQSITHDGSVAKDLIDFTSNIKKRFENLIDLTNFYLALYNESKDEFWIPAYYDQCDDIETFDAGKTITAYVLRSKKSLLANYDEICKLKDSGVIESLGVPAQVWMGVPLLVGDKAIGVLAVQSYDNPLLYNEQDKLLLERVAHEISYIIQRIKSDEEVKLALEKAEESDRLKSAFLANMSHEIRTPLNSIIGFSELLADSFFEEELKDEFVQHIITSGNQLLNIISDIVDISKIESGEIVIRKTELSAKKLLDEIRALHILKVESRFLHFRFAYPENITEITILADKERLHQVFNNLISNALKFTSEGHIEVGCRPKGEMFEFYVKDTGIGIDPKFHAKIFERFRQVETAFTRKFGGNGLGLAITKNLIELMGGKIWLESEPGKGSTFYFTVPLLEPEKINN